MIAIDHAITIKTCAIATDRVIKIEIWVIPVIHLTKIRMWRVAMDYVIRIGTREVTIETGGVMTDRVNVSRTCVITIDYVIMIMVHGVLDWITQSRFT